MSAHSIEIETGRYNATPVEQGFINFEHHPRSAYSRHIEIHVNI